MALLPKSSAARRWLGIVLIILVTVAVATFLVLRALDENVSFYKTPSELAVMGPSAAHIRLGGMVEANSIKHEGTWIYFRVTDNIETVNVAYNGLAPDLFREGQGVVAEGRINDKGTFVADRLLAKHDENYMPPEVARAMKQKSQ
jgi:cytochrome c-type biogenesis protein CcmE